MSEQEGNPAQEAAPENGESIEVLKKRFKDTQAAFTRASQEAAELRKRVAQLESGEQKEGEPADPFDFLKDETFRTEVDAQPSKALDATQTLVSQVARLAQAAIEEKGAEWQAKYDAMQKRLEELVPKVEPPVPPTSGATKAAPAAKEPKPEDNPAMFRAAVELAGGNKDMALRIFKRSMLREGK